MLHVPAPTACHHQTLTYTVPVFQVLTSSRLGQRDQGRHLHAPPFWKVWAQAWPLVRGPSLETQMMFGTRLGSDLVQTIEINYSEVTCSCAHLMPVSQPDSGNIPPT